MRIRDNSHTKRQAATAQAVKRAAHALRRSIHIRRQLICCCDSVNGAQLMNTRTDGLRSRIEQRVSAFGLAVVESARSCRGIARQQNVNKLGDVIAIRLRAQRSMPQLRSARWQTHIQQRKYGRIANIEASRAAWTLFACSAFAAPAFSSSADGPSSAKLENVCAACCDRKTPSSSRV